MDIVVIVKRMDSSSPDGKVMDYADKKALEMAVDIKEKSGRSNINVSALCIAPVEDSEIIRECYAFGADTGYLLADPFFETIDINGIITVISKAVERINDCSIVLMGSTTNDEAIAMVGKKLAEKLRLKYYSNITSIEATERHIFIKKMNNQEKENLELPAMVNIICDLDQKVHNAMRIMRAFKKEVKIWNSQDIGIDPKKIR